jgi:hypothetical protein
VKFAVSPPFFEFDETGGADGVVVGPDDGTWKKVYTLLRDYMVCGEFVSASVHRIFYFCFALLYFHFNFLKLETSSPRQEQVAGVALLHAHPDRDSSCGHGEIPMDFD